MTHLYYYIVPPLAVEIPGDTIQSINAGDTLSLSCSGTGSGTIDTIQWSMDGMDLMDETSMILEIVNATAFDGGEYTCTVNNGTANATVTVHITPQFTTSQPTQVSSDSMTILTCDATGFPDPVYVWGRVDGKNIGDDVETNSSTLVLGFLMFGDEGDYYCNATSGDVTIQSEAVTVTGKPII